MKLEDLEKALTSAQIKEAEELERVIRVIFKNYNISAEINAEYIFALRYIYNRDMKKDPLKNKRFPKRKPRARKRARII